MRVCVSIYVHKYRCPWSPERALTPPELEIQVVMSHLSWHGC